MKTIGNKQVRTGLSAAAMLFLVVIETACAQQGGGNGGGPGGGGRPPEEALTACKSLTSGQSCSFTRDNASVQGTCFSPEEGKPLACRPSNAPSGSGKKK